MGQNYTVTLCCRLFAAIWICLLWGKVTISFYRTIARGFKLCYTMLNLMIFILYCGMLGQAKSKIQQVGKKVIFDVAWPKTLQWSQTIINVIAIDSCIGLTYTSYLPAGHSYQATVERSLKQKRFYQWLGCLCNTLIEYSVTDDFTL